MFLDLTGQFEVPLLDEFDGHRATVAERQAAYEQATLAKTKAIRETEARNVKVRLNVHKNLHTCILTVVAAWQEEATR